MNFLFDKTNANFKNIKKKRFMVHVNQTLRYDSKTNVERQRHSTYGIRLRTIDIRHRHPTYCRTSIINALFKK